MDVDRPAGKAAAAADGGGWTTEPTAMVVGDAAAPAVEGGDGAAARTTGRFGILVGCGWGTVATLQRSRLVLAAETAVCGRGGARSRASDAAAPCSRFSAPSHRHRARSGGARKRRGAPTTKQKRRRAAGLARGVSHSEVVKAKAGKHRTRTEERKSLKTLW